MSISATTMYRDTFFYNLDSNNWPRGPYMNQAKRYHTCSLVTQPDGSQDIVIVGGSLYSSCEYQNDVDIVKLATNKIIPG